MANYAYRDSRRRGGDVIYAADAIKDDRDTIFFCPNPNCTAHLYICAVDGSRKAYFSATKAAYPHIRNCPYGANNLEFNPNKFDEKSFSFDDALKNLCVKTADQKRTKESKEHNSGESKKHALRTLKQIYKMCKNYFVSYTYGDRKIADMLLDDRSEYRYPKGFFGNRIIEAVIKEPLNNDIRREIYLDAPIRSRKYSFILRFKDEATYTFMRDLINNNREEIIVVAGEWKRADTYDYFVTDIEGKRQVAVIKRSMR